jgi:nickel-type superoxide dismutase maturation protease
MKLPRFLQRQKKPDTESGHKGNTTLQDKEAYIDYAPQKHIKELRISRWPFIIRRVQGHSMMPVLPPGTTVWGWRWYHELKIGDVIIFLHDGKEKIKRINDLDNNTVFVLGDHPETSTDSRQFGWVSRENIVATVFWPHAPKNRAESVA